MFEIFSYGKSYRAGVLQAKAFRILKRTTNDALQPYRIGATEWGILGLVYEATTDGVTYKYLAEELGVKPPYITKSVQLLLDMGYINLIANSEDARSKVVTISPSGKAFIAKVEPVVMKAVMYTLGAASKRNVIGYVQTLIAVVKQGSAKRQEAPDLDHIAE